MTWTDHLLGTEGLRRVFTGGPPIGDRLTLTGFDAGPGWASISLVLDEFPDHPHPRWRDAGFDAVACKVWLTQVTSLAARIDRLPAASRIEITRAEGDLVVALESTDLTVLVRCRTASTSGGNLKGVKRTEATS